MRILLGGVALVVLASCSPRVPDSGAGVGFGDYDEYQQQQAARDAALAAGGGTGTLASPSTISSQPLDATGGANAAADTGQSVAAQTRAALSASADAEQTAANSGVPVVNASPNNPAPSQYNTAGISDENDFESVESRRSIESDAQRIERLRAQYQVAEVEALPVRQGDSANIVQYALTSKHPAGAQIYRRIGINKENRYRRNCAGYASPDLAQIEFLEKGGPKRDRMGLDPDGDGYACAWDPEPFRKARG